MANSKDNKRAKRTREPQARNWRKRFLAVLRERGIVRAACEQAGVNRAAAYRARQEDAAFAEQWDLAIEDAVDLLEAEAWRRAFDGVTRRVYWKGECIDVIQEYSDRLMMLLLKGRRPSIFRDNVSVTGPDGGPIETRDVTGISDAELEHIAAGRRKGTAATPARAATAD